MFVYSVKTSKAKMIIIAAVIVAAAGVLVFFGSRGRGAETAQDGAISYKAEDSAQRLAFLSQFGWRIAEDPAEVSEVIIPQEFDKGYTEYAEMNRAQGLDLGLYKGVRAKRWTYNVLNYPGYENRSGVVQANLLIYEGRVIGGDICSLEQGGFMQGFDFPDIGNDHRRADRSSRTDRNRNDRDPTRRYGNSAASRDISSKKCLRRWDRRGHSSYLTAVYQPFKLRRLVRQDGRTP